MPVPMLHEDGLTIADRLVAACEEMGQGVLQMHGQVTREGIACAQVQFASEFDGVDLLHVKLNRVLGSPMDGPGYYFEISLSSAI